MDNVKKFKFSGNVDVDTRKLLYQGYDAEKAFRAAFEYASKYKGSISKKSKVNNSND